MQYVSRAAAGLRPPRSRQTLGRVSALWLHHEGGPRRTGADEAAAWRAIQAFSMNSLGYADTDYSFGVGLSGTVYEGRGWGVMSAATLNNNATSYSICAIGNFETEDEPTDALLRGIADVCRDGIARGFLTPGVYPTGGHRDAPNMGGFSTSCPGRKLEAALPTIRSYLGAPGAPVPQEDDDMGYAQWNGLEKLALIRDVAAGVAAVLRGDPSIPGVSANPDLDLSFLLKTNYGDGEANKRPSFLHDVHDGVGALVTKLDRIEKRLDALEARQA